MLINPAKTAHFVYDLNSMHLKVSWTYWYHMLGLTITEWKCHAKMSSNLSWQGSMYYFRCCRPENRKANGTSVYTTGCGGSKSDCILWSNGIPAACSHDILVIILNIHEWNFKWLMNIWNLFENKLLRFVSPKLNSCFF